MKRERIQNEYMFDTPVENIFINEYMASAPGDFVKVYLLALMYADLFKEIDDEGISKTLYMAVEDVKRAWKYWEELGVIRRVKGEIVFPQLKEGIYGMKKPQKKTIGEEKNQQSLHFLDNSSMQQMFSDIEKTLARPLNGIETDSILEWIDSLGAAPEVISFAYKYCVERKKENVKYIGKVVEGWTGRGFRSVSQVEEFLEDVDKRHYVYKRILKALGFFRNVTEEERRIIDRWLDEFGFSMDMILEACGKTSGISNPNINYVNSVLINWNKEKTGKDENGTVTRKHVMEYYDFIREKAKEEAKIRRDEIQSLIPQIGDLEKKIKDNYLRITKTAISGGEDKQAVMGQLKSENDSLSREIKKILTEKGVPADYMDIRYKCPICKDTGITEDGLQCKCYVTRAEEAAEWIKEI